MSSATVDGVITRYGYTSDGIRNRVAEDGGETTNYIIDSMTPSGYAQVVEELASGVLTVRYTYHRGRPSRIVVIAVFHTYRDTSIWLGRA